MSGQFLQRCTPRTGYTPDDHWVWCLRMRWREFNRLLSVAAAWPRELAFAGLTPVLLATVIGLTLSACSQPSDTPPSAQQPTAADRVRKDADDKAWADAEKIGSAAAFNVYLQNFGSGAHAAEARRRIAALNEQAVGDQNRRRYLRPSHRA